ncbi:SAM-dependent methyltransferase [Streptomyces sp. APSN-46.1]|uniref:N-6 DNA methylase n=1 Tax=Streptomyces sp. APSN-46.1 TaxID=2929049 RepID=UPI001FB38DEB|nr:N-6 DNA methylase [Streptomyces sp. APSN-46.1]MCJ1676121.1 SAM-dependent methyltransferase [Streptomyces sp. APSN-46.1]
MPTQEVSPLSARVRQLTRRLAGRLNAHDACRVVIGLVYLRNRAQIDSLDVFGSHAKPSWFWLVEQARAPQPLGPHVRMALTQWLSPAFAPADTEAGKDYLPRLPATIDDDLRSLVRAIDKVDRVGDLLEQCLEDLSNSQAKGGHYFTPRDIVRLMVAAAAPQDGHHVLDPVCGSAGLLAEADRHVREQTGLQPSLVLTGRDLHAGTLQIAQLNLAVRGIPADLGTPVDSLAQPSSRPYDIVLANPPFNDPSWGSEVPPSQDPRWPGMPTPPRDKANFAWILHIAHALAPQGRAAFLMADGAARGVRPAERAIRQYLVREDLIEAVVALPPGLFSHTRIPCCLWLLNRDKSPHRGWGSSDRRNNVLFINARRANERVPGARQWRLTADGAEKIQRTLAAWRGALPPDGEQARYEDEPGWCRSCSAENIAEHDYEVLPLSYASEQGDDDVTELWRIDELKQELYGKFEEAHLLERDLRRMLEEL